MPRNTIDAEAYEKLLELLTTGQYTAKELSKKTGLSVRTVYRYLYRAIDEGYGLARGLRQGSPFYLVED